MNKKNWSIKILVMVIGVVVVADLFYIHHEQRVERTQAVLKKAKAYVKSERLLLYYQEVDVPWSPWRPVTIKSVSASAPSSVVVTADKIVLNAVSKGRLKARIEGIRYAAATRGAPPQIGGNGVVGEIAVDAVMENGVLLLKSLSVSAPGYGQGALSARLVDVTADDQWAQAQLAAAHLKLTDDGLLEKTFSKPIPALRAEYVKRNAVYQSQFGKDKGQWPIQARLTLAVIDLVLTRNEPDGQRKKTLDLAFSPDVPIKVINLLAQTNVAQVQSVTNRAMPDITVVTK